MTFLACQFASLLTGLVGLSPEFALAAGYALGIQASVGVLSVLRDIEC